jgi:hypothetical protein
MFSSCTLVFSGVSGVCGYAAIDTGSGEGLRGEAGGKASASPDRLSCRFSSFFFFSTEARGVSRRARVSPPALRLSSTDKKKIF